MNIFEFDYRNTRAFNAEHALNGAPFCCSNGYEVDVISWDLSKEKCLTGDILFPDGAMQRAIWRADGHFESDAFHIFNLVMVPIGMCKDGYVFVGDELVKREGDSIMHFCAKPSTRIQGNVRKHLSKVEVPNCILEFDKATQEALTYMLTVQVGDVIEYLSKANPGALIEAAQQLQVSGAKVALEESFDVS